MAWPDGEYDNWMVYQELVTVYVLFANAAGTAASPEKKR
jgi:hypothetical protein